MSCFKGIGEDVLLKNFYFTGFRRKGEGEMETSMMRIIDRLGIKLATLAGALTGN